jgi:hypothetical protein
VDFLADLLNNIKIIGPLGVVAAIESYAIYTLFNKLEALQEQRLNDWKTMRDEYTQLSKDINNTLDAILKMFGRKNNGNGN